MSRYSLSPGDNKDPNLEDEYNPDEKSKDLNARDADELHDLFNINHIFEEQHLNFAEEFEVISEDERDREKAKGKSLVKLSLRQRLRARLIAIMISLLKSLLKDAGLSFTDKELFAELRSSGSFGKLFDQVKNKGLQSELSKLKRQWISILAYLSRVTEAAEARNLIKYSSVTKGTYAQLNAPMQQTQLKAEQQTLPKQLLEMEKVISVAAKYSALSPQLARELDLANKTNALVSNLPNNNVTSSVLKAACISIRPEIQHCHISDKPVNQGIHKIAEINILPLIKLAIKEVAGLAKDLVGSLKASTIGHFQTNQQYAINPDIARASNPSRHFAESTSTAGQHREKFSAKSECFTGIIMQQQCIMYAFTVLDTPRGALTQIQITACSQTTEYQQTRS